MKVMIVMFVAALAFASAFPEPAFTESTVVPEEFAEAEVVDADPIALAQKAVKDAENCNRVTGGTCRVFSCYDWRKATCQNASCNCPGKCAVYDSGKKGKKCMDLLTPAKADLKKALCTKAEQEGKAAESTVHSATAAVSSAEQEGKAAEQALQSAKDAASKAKVKGEAAYQAKAAEDNNVKSAQNCNRVTGGTCRVFSCYGWRKAKCQSASCNCVGKCAVYDSNLQGKKCVDLVTPAEAKLEIEKGHLKVAQDELKAANDKLAVQQSNLKAAESKLSTAKSTLSTAQGKLKLAKDALGQLKC
jgi:hypothetical protein